MTNPDRKITMARAGRLGGTANDGRMMDRVRHPDVGTRAPAARGSVVGSIGLGASILLGALMAAWTSSAAFAMSQGTTAQDERFLSGGIALGERAALESRRNDFNLRVLTAAKGSGEYLANTEVKIVDKSGRIVLNTRLDGPWLLVNLKPGEYTVDAWYAGQRVQKSTTIHPNEHLEMNLYFDVDAA
jgi:hypothetical protein